VGRPLTLTAGLYADQLTEHRQGFQNFVGTELGVQGRVAPRRGQPRAQLRPVRAGELGQRALRRHRWACATRACASSPTDHFIVGANGDDSGSASYSATTPMLGAVCT
jgi:iron complex outermembrane receptor protein